MEICTYNKIIMRTLLPIKTALLYISSEILSINIDMTKKCSNRYFITVEDFENKYKILTSKLKKYSNIIVILRISGHPKIKDKDYTFYTIDDLGNNKHIKASSLLIKIIALNNKAKFDIIVTACFGFYAHEYADLLSKNSLLITLSDYKSLSTYTDIFYDYSIKPKSKLNVFAIMLYYFNCAPFKQMPCIFISYYYKDKLRITSLFHYITFKYNFTPLLKNRSLSEINSIIKNHYYTFTITSFKVKPSTKRRMLQFKKMIKLYRDPYQIVKELNKGYSKKSFNKDNYFRNLYKKEHNLILSIKEQAEKDIMNESTCKLEIIMFLKLIQKYKMSEHYKVIDFFVNNAN